jgi:hypothetical protein
MSVADVCVPMFQFRCSSFRCCGFEHCIEARGFRRKLLCKKPAGSRFVFAIAAEQEDFSASIHGGRRMSFAVPIILALAFATGYYGRADWDWQNWQNAKQEQSDKSDDDSSKDKSDKGDESSSSKTKSGHRNKSGKSARNSAAAKRQE